VAWLRACGVWCEPQVFACRDCRRTNPDLETISMSRAKTEFGAKEKELEKLEFMTRTNPMNPKGPPMRLFLRKDVRRLMAKKYGGEDKLNRVVKARLAKEQEKPAASIFPTSQKASFIKFCSARGASYGCFSTFSMHPFTMGGKQWPTVEHYVQGQKFAGLPMEELIRKTPDPLRAKKIGEVKGIPPRSDWKDKQEEIICVTILSPKSQVRVAPY